MNDNELKMLWQRQSLREPELSADQLIAAMQTKTREFRRTLRARDARELLACGAVILVFGFYLVNERTPVVRLGWLIVIGGSIFAAWKLIRARHTTPPAAPGATVVESLQAELNSVRAQSRLLGSVLWWYLLPPGIGLLVATWGMPIHLHAKIPATLMYLAVYAFIYWLNRWARTKQLLPMEAQLESLLHSAETAQPLDETRFADLRPIVLSTSTGSTVKPVEFNVAFLQIALYAEVGFVGMWFFSILSKASGNASFSDFVSAIFSPQHVIDFMLHAFNGRNLVLVVPFFFGGLLLSWILKKGTDRAVGISSLGVHLVRGQQLFPWNEIKEVRVFRFLNIRSLWMIKESGEKTIMPWSSLDRHSELKAAVEHFAPVNHPLRKHLSLLKRV